MQLKNNAIICGTEKGGSAACAVCPTQKTNKLTWFLKRQVIIASDEFHIVETSFISCSLCRPNAACCWCSSSVFAGLCLKCPTILWHFVNASTNPLSERQTVLVLCNMFDIACDHTEVFLLQQPCFELCLLRWWMPHSSASVWHMHQNSATWLSSVLLMRRTEVSSHDWWSV